MSYKSGFSLLELLIAMAIVAILAGTALPAYRSHVIKLHRVDGKIGLLKLAVALEEDKPPEYLSPKGFYHLKIINYNSTERDFILAAIPVQSQKNDTQCGALAINSNGQKGRWINNAIVLDKKCW